MNIFPFMRKNHVRDDLSAYLDGELAPGRASDVETHVAGCEACRLELADLRATVMALREMPQVQAPRSFALTERMLAREPAPRPVADRRWTLELGTRMAGAAVAVVLAVVVLVDINGTGGGAGDDDDSGSARAEITAEMALTQGDTFDSNAGGVAGIAPEGTSLAPEGGEDVGSIAGAAGETPKDGDATAPDAPSFGSDATSVPELMIPATGDDVDEDDSTDREGDDDSSAESSPSLEFATDAGADDEDGGMSTLTLIEIVLGGLLAVIAAAAIAARLFKREPTI